MNEVLLQDIVKMESVDDQDNEPLSNIPENVDKKPSSKLITIKESGNFNNSPKYL